MSSHFAPRHPRRSRAGRPRGFVPRLEALEDRALPSTLTVTNTNDSGPGSLRGALAAAADGDTITFAHDLANKTITLTSGALAVNASVGIQGPEHSVTVSGGGKSGVFVVAAGTNVSIANLTVADGLAAQGGGIDNMGSLTLTQDQVVNDQAVGNFRGGGLGGGVFNEQGASLALNDCTFANDQVVGNRGGFGFGGGLLNMGTAVVTGTTFTGDQATGGGNPFAPPFSTFGAYGSGGAISNQFGTLSVTTSQFFDNMAIGGPPIFGFSSPVSYAFGGAIDDNSGNPLPVTDCTFVGNQAVGSQLDTLVQGGAIQSGYLAGATGLSVSNCQFLDNVISAAASPAALGAFGGAVSVTSGFTGTVAISHSTFTGNQALDGPRSAFGAQGGALSNEGFSNFANLVLDTCTFTDNSVTAATQPLNSFGGTAGGGGVWNSGVNLTVTNSTFTGNLAQGGAGDVDGITGGGLYHAFGNVTVSGSTFTGNRALGGDGSSGRGGDGRGGGMYTLLSGPSGAAITNSSFTGNRARGGDGGPGNGGGAGQGGGFYTQDFGQFSGGPNAVSLSQIIATGNAAVGGQGGSGADGGAGQGGGLYEEGNHIFNPGQLANAFSLADGIVALNTAAGGAGGDGGNGGPGAGGGLYADGLTGVTVTDSAFALNTARGGAGGSGGDATGGGVALQAFVDDFGTSEVGTLTMSDSLVAGNQAVGGAGGTGGNGGNGLGGGLYAAAGSTVALDSVFVTGNRATGGAAGSGGDAGQGLGGGLYLAPGSVVTLKNCRVSGNHASTASDDIWGAWSPG